MSERTVLETARAMALDEAPRRTVANHHPLIYGFETIVRARGRSIESVANASGVSGPSIFNWFAGHSPRVTQLDYALRSLGFRLAICPLVEDPTAVILAREVRRP